MSKTGSNIGIVVTVLSILFSVLKLLIPNNQPEPSIDFTKYQPTPTKVRFFDPHPEKWNWQRYDLLDSLSIHSPVALEKQGLRPAQDSTKLIIYRADSTEMYIRVRDARSTSTRNQGKFHLITETSRYQVETGYKIKEMRFDETVPGRCLISGSIESEEQLQIYKGGVFNIDTLGSVMMVCFGLDDPEVQEAMDSVLNSFERGWELRFGKYIK